MDSTNRNLVVALVVLVVVALTLSSMVGGMMGPAMMGRGEGWMWRFGMWPGGMAMLVFWAALIVGVILIVRLLAGSSLERDVRTSPLDILKRRYASGEITREQYELMRKDLEP